MTDQNEKDSGPEKSETLFGGVTMTVGMLGGNSEEVLIRQLPIRQFPELLQALGDEPKLVELLTGKPPGWSDNLEIQSFEAVILEGERINRDFFGRWLQRAMARQEMLVPGLREKLSEGAASGLLTSSAASPSKPDSPSRKP